MLYDLYVEAGICVQADIPQTKLWILQCLLGKSRHAVLANKFCWWSGSVGSIVVCINKVSQHQAQLVLGWVTIPVCNQPPWSTQPGHPFMGRRNEYQRRLGLKQAHCVMH